MRASVALQAVAALAVLRKPHRAVSRGRQGC